MDEGQRASRIPTEVRISIADAEEALRYWLSNVVLRNEVEIETLEFSQRGNVFKIKLGRGG